MAGTLDGDHQFKFVYAVSYDANTGVAKLLDSDDAAGIQPALKNVTVNDTINNSSGSDADNSQIIGDRPNDKFTVTGAGANSGLNGTYTFISAAKSANTGPEGADTDYGFIAKKGQLYYFFTDTKVTGAANAKNSALTLLEDTDQWICFMPGTAIATPEGTKAVETLAIGDLVVTSDGRAVPVRWIGRQTVSTLFADENRLPVRITAGALGDNLPVRDLLVSNDHALLVEGVLVQAGAMINGTTIRRERNVPAVFTYYHVELDDHSLILAENVPAETFVDNVERYAFDNWAEHEALYPNGRSVAELDLPRVKAHRQLPGAVRRLIASRVPADQSASAA